MREWPDQTCVKVFFWVAVILHLAFLGWGIARSVGLRSDCSLILEYAWHSLVLLQFVIFLVALVITIKDYALWEAGWTVTWMVFLIGLVGVAFVQLGSRLLMVYPGLCLGLLAWCIWRPPRRAGPSRRQ